MPSVLLIASTLVLGYAATFIYSLGRNWINSKRTGLPSVVVPIDPNHIVWMLTSSPLRPWFQKRLPKIIYERMVLAIYGWEFHQKFSGPQGGYESYILVTCGRLELWTWDHEVAAQITSRPKDFNQLEIASIILNQFGENVLTSDGDHWTRQRKVVAAVINERISKTVFNESVVQTQGMLQEAHSKANNQDVTETNSLFEWSKKIAIHVLSGAGMGASVPWDDNSGDKPKPGFKQTYIQSMKSVVNAMYGSILLPRWFLLNYPGFLPGYSVLSTLGTAKEEFPLYMADLLEDERQRSRADGGATKNNVLSQLLQASENPVDPDHKSALSRQSKALSEGEILGNLFVVSVAGFDTTANTISYALALLARHPDWQEWLFEEVDEILPSDPDAELDYVATFPKATRTLAFMFETLRLFTPLIHISKQTKTAQTITTSEGTYWLPANTTVYINCVALHLDPKVWRNLNLHPSEQAAEDDASKFRPTRWINVPATPQPHYIPAKGTYLPWSGGPRVCPGQKMAQVEFVAIFLTLLRQHRIDAAPIGDESREQVERRLDTRMKNSISVLTLQMRDVYDVSESDPSGLKLRISKRK